MRLIVTTSWRFAYGFDEIGVMAIVHTPGEPMPIELLDGLDVIFHFDDCAKSMAVVRMLCARDVKPARYACWCKCYGELTKFVMPCGEKHFHANWMDAWTRDGAEKPAAIPLPERADTVVFHARASVSL